MSTKPDTPAAPAPAAARSLVHNPKDASILADVDAAIARGEDPFGDDEDIVAETIDQKAQKAAENLAEERRLAGDEPDEETKAEADEADEAEEEGEEEEAQEGDETPDDEAKEEGEPDAEAKADEAPTEAPAAPEVPSLFDEQEGDIEVPQLSTIDVKAIETKITELNAKEDEAFAKLMDGEEGMTPAQYSQLKSEIARERDALNRRLTVAETQAETFKAAENRAIQRIISDAKKAGIDYTDGKAAAQFDAALAFVRATPDADTASLSALYRAAHKMVADQRGVKTAAAPAPAPAAAPAVPPKAKAADPAERELGKPPATLRGLPQAQSPGTTNDLASALGRLKGADYEAAYAKLTPAQQAALLDD